MKIIISHDVDHITVWEHKKDFIIPKFIVRNFIEFCLGYISASEISGRFKNIIKNKWQNLEELMKFNKENRIPSTFFIGVSKGMYLNYSLKDSGSWINRILREGFDVGVHGIAYEDFNSIKKEYEIFKELSGMKRFGIRIHYLSNSENTVYFLREAGYLFDSSSYAMRNPYKVGGLWEFPLHIMDAYVFYKNSRWQNQNLEQARANTKRVIDDLQKNGINYITVLFHDRYFSDGFRSWKNWYIWFSNWCKENGFEFINYRKAVQELEKTK